MKTKRVKVYSFTELSEQAKQTAINNYSANNDVSFIYDEAHKTVKEFHNIFNTQEGYNSWLDIRTGHIEDNILNLSGLRLYTYLWNNYHTQIFKGKYYGKLVQTHEDGTPIEKSKEHPAGYRHVKRYSKCFLDTSCVLTGMCYDEDILAPIYKFLAKYNHKNDQNTTLEDLLTDCMETLRLSLQNEEDYRNSAECITEEIEANELEFLENGKLFNL